MSRTNGGLPDLKRLLEQLPNCAVLLALAHQLDQILYRDGQMRSFLLRCLRM